MAQFGEMLAELRQERRLKQEDLAEILHVVPGTISNYENGRHFPDVAKLINLADFFDVTTDYLLGRCDYNLSPNVFHRRVVDHMTVGEMIRDIEQMSQEQRKALTVIIEAMEYSVRLEQYNKEK